MPRTLFPLLLVLAWPAALRAQPKADPPGPGDAGANVYRQVLRSTAWILSDRGGGKLATGSGSLVDKGRRLVLTNYHVVGDVKKATVYFPDFGPDKKAVSDRKHYLDRGRLAIPGEVVEIDKEGDLALIRLDRVPDGVPELPLAASTPDPGTTVHSIGNPGKSGALWVYTPGKVRQVYSKKWKARLDERTVLPFEAKVIETDSPTNPGDSGGPLANDKGELVGVTQGGATDAQALSIFVDLSEVKRLLNRRSVQALRSTDDKPKPHRDAALKSTDEAKFFSDEAWKQVSAAADRLLKEKGLDLVIETYPTPPKGDAEKVRAMTAADREKFFGDFARERARAEKVVGLYVVINKAPGSLYVERSEAAGGKVPDEVVTKVKQALLAAFREKKYDDGLAAALKLVLESQGLGAKPEGKRP
ncbi:MAG: hypothetical protein C0501_03925 [Isosphaera sp.]|nr:hypothetical protein [Isosphaera sp.]